MRKDEVRIGTLPPGTRIHAMTGELSLCGMRAPDDREWQPSDGPPTCRLCAPRYGELLRARAGEPVTTRGQAILRRGLEKRGLLPVAGVDHV